jgi:hypothetical protein
VNQTDNLSIMASVFQQSFHVPQGVLVRELAGESVLLNLNTEAYFGLDEVGTRMWKVLTGQGQSAEAALAALLGEYEVEESKLRADMEGFIQRLLELGLLDARALK